MQLARFKKYLSPEYTLSRVQDRIARAFFSPYSPKTLSWELPDDKLHNAILHWPKYYSWARGNKWMEPLKEGFKRHLKVVDSDIEQPEGCVVEIHLEMESEKLPISIDYSDYFEINEEQARKSVVYFKMQCHDAGYKVDNVKPGGFITNDSLAYFLLEDLREVKEKRFDVYGRFSLKFATGTRKKALELLHSQKKFRFEGSESITSYGRYLRECAASKACLDLPGNGQICFRLIDYLCLGCSTVSVSNNVVFPVALEDEKHLLFCKQDLSDLVEKCEAIVEDSELRNRLSSGAKDYFDSYLHKEQLTCFYLNQLLKG